MRIYKMTATFGKLERATLELEPGLNVITAPNEWGKSTWCAFLLAMLYGLDTRAKTTKNALADKERYAPWSGSPMAGRIDLNWKGRDITIERRSASRVPLGEFRAYETASGLPVQELTASNCGAMLLGVERSVFRRAGFIRQADLPVTQDEALRRRLNALVTTGDDSGAADRLANRLKELKNQCRYNRTGLLPQAEAEQRMLEEKLAAMQDLNDQIQKLRRQMEDISEALDRLRNHQQTQAYEKMCRDLARLEETKAQLMQLQQSQRQLEAACSDLPPLEEAERMVRELRTFREQWNALQPELQALPEEPRKPQLPPPFAGLTPEEARDMVRRDKEQMSDTFGGKSAVVLILVGVLGNLSAGALAFLKALLFAAIAETAGIVALVWGIWELKSRKKKRRQLREKYGHSDWHFWETPVREYEREMAAYRAGYREYQTLSRDLEMRLGALQKKRETLCGREDPELVADFWEDVRRRQLLCNGACRETQQVQRHYETLQSMVQPVAQPSQPDALTCSEAETASRIAEHTLEQQRLQNRLGQLQGQLEVLGDPRTLRDRLEQVKDRIARLEDTYAALTIAQETLAAARAQLQRRFAPRITKKAQKLLAEMTDGRYHTVTMGEDFSLQAGAGQEETLRDALWRSDGTVDQLYLALRLAIAEELTPGAPLVLDDVLVRFDDGRMRRAVSVLKALAENRQVILFTCQGRENDR